VTASSGTNTQAVHARTVDRLARRDQPQGEADLARSVSLSARDWSCPWPREAESLGIDEQTVVLRAVVSSEGHASSVHVLADPGHGFGQAALTCARQARFEPATDRNGQPYAATSPPIRVRFTR
jgi:protein TonB